MASLPSINDREHDLQKRIVENTYGGYFATESAVEAIHAVAGEVDIALRASPLEVQGQANDIIEEVQTTGAYRAHSSMVWRILGRRAGFTSTSVLNDVKEFDNSVAAIPILSNSSLDILSSSVNDDVGGTGINTVRVAYINSSNNFVQSDPIELDGTTLRTNVLTGVNAVLWMEAETVGSGAVAVGNIRLRINGGVIEVEQITAGGNKSLSARIMVPAGYNAYLTSWDGHCVNADQDMRLRATVNTATRALIAPYLFQDNAYLAVNTTIGMTCRF